MPDLNVACDNCKPAVSAEFAAGGLRRQEIIAGDVITTERCYVRDEIHFINSGRLIFAPASEKEGYYSSYYVICRRLVITGGKEPERKQCEADDPGKMYDGNNVITWRDRINNAASGAAPVPPRAPEGQSYAAWSDTGIGDDGANGGDGQPGHMGYNGRDGKNAPHFTLICTEVEFNVIDLGGSHLSIDFNGQNGGEGGHGQDGGNGGRGMNGRQGSSDTSWPGSSCERQPGNGGIGGRGGDGGQGGTGGSGGNAGNITIITTAENITSGPFVSGRFSYVNDGGYGGLGGRQGFGGRGGARGEAGPQTSECSTALSGTSGVDGSPATLSDASANQGITGASGNRASIVFEKLVSGQCADIIPIDPTFDAGGLQPSHYCRGFATAASGEGSIIGQHLSQISRVEVSLAGVTATIRPSSTDTQLDLKIDILGTSAVGSGNLVFHRYFGPSVTRPNAISIGKFDVSAISPGNGARGTSVDVTITGQCFDTSASVVNVIVSGASVNVYNPILIDDTKIQCTFEIGNLAQIGPRDVTVKTGLFQKTMLNSFNVT